MAALVSRTGRCGKPVDGARTARQSRRNAEAALPRDLHWRGWICDGSRGAGRIALAPVRISGGRSPPPGAVLKRKGAAQAEGGLAA